MRPYGRVFTQFWIDEDVKKLSDSAKLLALYLLTSPHSNAVGCFRLPDGYIAGDLDWPVGQVELTMHELLAMGFCIRCNATGFLMIRNYLRFNPIENPNVGKAVARTVEAIPKNTVLMGPLYDALKPFRERLPKGFVEAMAERLPKPEPTASANTETETERETEPERETDPETEIETETSARAREGTAAPPAMRGGGAPAHRQPRTEPVSVAEPDPGEVPNYDPAYFEIPPELRRSAGHDYPPGWPTNKLGDPIAPEAIVRGYLGEVPAPVMRRALALVEDGGEGGP